MKSLTKKLVVVMAASALALSACSSDSDSSGNEQGDTVAGANSLDGKGI